MGANTLSLCVLALLAVVLVGANDVNRARIHNKKHQMTSLDVEASNNGTGPFIFMQTLDHFVPSSSPFSQRYYVNNSFWKGPQGPAFLIIGGEGEMSGNTVISGAVVNLAQQYGATVFALEHRFYGESVPFDLLNSTALSYLTIEQALADLVNFQASMVSQYNLSSSTKWVFFGCSYSGALAAWYRLKYPQFTFGVLAGSAPVEAVLDFYQYDQVVSASLGPICAAAVHNATLQIQDLLFNNETNSDIRARLGCMEVTDDVAVLYVLADTIAYAVQYSHSVSQVCANFTNSTNLVDTYVNFVNFLYNTTDSTCVSFDISSYTNETVNPSDNMRQWMWQSCLQVGYFQTAPQNNSLRSTLIDVAWHLQVCEKLFNGASNEPRVGWTNSVYGGDTLSTSNTIFTNGALDPWKALSVVNSKAPSVPSIMIEGVAHCANWYGPRSTDSPALIAARAQVAAYVGAFLDSCGGSGGGANATSGCGGNGVCTFVAANNSVDSVCACTNGYTGALCDTPQSPVEPAKSEYKLEWWYLVIVGVAAALIAGLIGGLVGDRMAKSRMYTSVDKVSKPAY